jgi:cold shock CspA family protein
VIVTTTPDRRVASFHGRVVASPEANGYGFVEPDRGGGQLLFRGSSVAGFHLRVGESVRYTLADGSFALEAVAVTRSDEGRALSPRQSTLQTDQSASRGALMRGRSSSRILQRERGITRVFGTDPTHNTPP